MLVDHGFADVAGLDRLDVPSAVIGVDDIPAAAIAAPPLTTVTTDDREIAHHIVQALVCNLAGQPPPPAPGSYLGHLIKRESAWPGAIGREGPRVRGTGRYPRAGWHRC